MVCYHWIVYYQIKTSTLISTGNQYQDTLLLYVILPNVFYIDKNRKMVDGERAVHTVQEEHVRKSGEGNSMPEMGQLTRLLIDANRCCIHEISITVQRTLLIS